MLAHDWDLVWTEIEPALSSLREAALERHPDLHPTIESTRGSSNAYFGAYLHFWADPVNDEQELVIIEFEVRSLVLHPGRRTAHVFEPADPAVVSFEIWEPTGEILTDAKQDIPSGATAGDIERITGQLFTRVLDSMPAHTVLSKSAHGAATREQNRQTICGTYQAEYEVASRALQAAGVDASVRSRALDHADQYFRNELGLTSTTPLRTPGTRRSC